MGERGALTLNRALPPSPQLRPPERPPNASDLRLRELAIEFSGAVARSLDTTSADAYAASPGGDRAVSRAIFGKWSLEILLRLAAAGPLGFSDLRTGMNGISARILSAKLQQLERLGLASREVLATRPPRVRYRATEAGETLAKLGESMLLYLRFLERRLKPPTARGRAAVVVRARR